MSETKNYEVGLLRFAFTPQGDPFEGRLRAMAPELAPFTSEVKLARSLSRNRYAKGAAEDCGMDQKELKRALNALCSLREEEIEALVGRSGVLGRFVTDATEIHGVVGEKAPLKLLGLNALGAQLAPLPNGKPVGANVVLIATWGRGKNHLCDAVATLLPEGFYLAFESASAKSLFYLAERDPRILSNRWIYLNEAEAMDQLVELLRPLISGGKAVHLTVNKDGGGRNAAQELRIEGPVTTTIPTIRNKLDAQLQSRMLLAELEDYEGRVASHTRKFSESLKPDFATEDYSARIAAWRAALGSLTAIRRVVFPLDHEDFCFDRDDVPHGARLWANLIGMMFAHAWLEQRNREIVELPNGEKAVMATPTDYGAAYVIFKATCERSVMNISDSHRRILDAVYQLQQENRSTNYLGFNDNDKSWSQREIARRTGVPQSTISAQKTYLVKSLKLLVEEYDGKLRLADDADPSWWRKEGVLDGLPKPKQVRAWWNGEDDPPDPGTPGRPEHPPEDPADRPVGGANGDRGSSGHHSEAPGQPAEEPDPQADRGGDAGDPRDPGQENALDKPENGQEGAPTGATGGFESSDGVSREDAEPENHIRDTNDYEGGSHAVSKAPTHAEWNARSAKENLDILGWARARTFVPAEPTESAGDYSVPEEDPVAHMLGGWLWWGEGSAMTVRRLFKLRAKDKSEEELRSVGWPADPQEMQERMERVVPFLQGRNPFYEDLPPKLDRFMHFECWEKGSMSERLWILIPAREEGPTREKVEELVWSEAMYVEGIAPPNPFRRD